MYFDPVLHSGQRPRIRVAAHSLRVGTHESHVRVNMMHIPISKVAGERALVSVNMIIARALVSGAVVCERA